MFWKTKSCDKVSHFFLATRILQSNRTCVQATDRAIILIVPSRAPGILIFLVT